MICTLRACKTTTCRASVLSSCRAATSYPSSASISGKLYLAASPLATGICPWSRYCCQSTPGIRRSASNFPCPVESSTSIRVITVSAPLRPSSLTLPSKCLIQSALPAKKSIHSFIGSSWLSGKPSISGPIGLPSDPAKYSVMSTP